MDKFERFEAWLRENGAQFDLLELREYQDGFDDDDDDEDHHDDEGSLDHLEEEKKEPNGYSGLNNHMGSEEGLVTTSSHHHHHRLHRSLTPSLSVSPPSGLSSNMTKSITVNNNNNNSYKRLKESEMRGVHARSRIPANTVCMSVPRKCLITVEMGQATPIGKLIAASDLDLDAPKHIYLMIYILWDRKVNGSISFFHPYYDILPKTLSNMPIFWTRTEKAFLQGSYLLEQIQDRDTAITEDYHAICSVAPILRDVCTLDEFKWARMCVCSRNFGLSMDGHRTSALVPHADMLNHYRPRETKWTFDEERQAFTITTLQAIPAGAQVYDSYGQKCNHRFLLNYGFAVEDNRELDGFCPNEVPIELFISPNDPIYRLKLEFWLRGEPGCTGSNHNQSPALSSNTLAQALTSVAAIAAGTTAPANTTNLLKTGGDSTMAMTPTSHDALVTVVEAAVNYRNRNNHYLHLLNSNQDQSHYDLQVPGATTSSSCSSNNTHSSSSSLSSMTGLSKRVRVCVSNNENTRLLFSLLRAAVCNEDELVAITTPVPSLSASGYSDSMNSGIGARSTLFGMGPPQVPPLFSSSFISESTTSPRVYYRSCRDIRHPISIRNERAAMQMLLDSVGRHLAQYPTSLAQDMADLMDERSFPRFSNQRHAKIQVRGEKEVLHHFGLWARTALNVLQIMESELLQERQAMISAGGDGSSSVGPAATATPAASSTFRSSTLSTSGGGGGSSRSNIGSSSSNIWMTNNSGMLASCLRRTNNSNSNSRVAAADGHFDFIIESMEEDTSLHHAIVRYCADVLGSLRREEFKNLRRQRALWNNIGESSSSIHNPSIHRSF